MMNFGHSKQNGHGSTSTSGSALAVAHTGGGNGGAIGELSQLALWMAASLAGMVTAVLTARTPFFRGVMRRLGVSNAAATGRSTKALLARPTKEQSLPMLAEAIVGSSKSAIASVFGPPRSAVIMQATAAATSIAGATYWQANTWYYPLPKSGPLAMAIEFAGDDATNVEFLRAPEV